MKMSPRIICCNAWTWLSLVVKPISCFQANQVLKVQKDFDPSHQPSTVLSAPPKPLWHPTFA